jgi:hypothetical protein
VSLQRQVAETDLPVGADGSQHFGDVSVDLAVAEGACDRNAVVSVLDEVELSNPIDLDRRKRLASPGSRGKPLPAWAQTPRCRSKSAVELARAIDCTYDRVELDRLKAQPAFAAVP